MASMHKLWSMGSCDQDITYHFRRGPCEILVYYKWTVLTKGGNKGGEQGMLFNMRVNVQQQCGPGMLLMSL